MNGDLRFLRKRWWGAWALLFATIFCLLLMVPDAVAAKGPTTIKSSLQHWWPSVLCVFIVLGCYAPWTFFWAVRTLGFLAFAAFVSMVILEIQNESRWGEGRTPHSVVSLIQAFFFFALPGLFLFLLRRPRTCPYDARGRLRPIETQRTIRLKRPADVAPIEWNQQLRELVKSIRPPRRSGARLKLESGPNADSTLQLWTPIDEQGEAVLTKLCPELENRGIEFAVGPQTTCDTTFRNQFESVLTRLSF